MRTGTLAELNMTMKTLQHSKYYHLYNRGNNRENLFRTSDNYLHFLRLYEKYIFPIAETFAWVLMKNHFHLLVKIKTEGEINLNELPNPARVSNPGRINKLKLPHLYFSDLFNAYTQSYNKMYQRTGSLFEKPFHRVEVTSEHYFRQLVVYIHTNPVHHGFTGDFKDYPWSSYGSVLSVKPTKLNRETVVGWFDDKANFIEVHNKQKVDMYLIKDLVIE
jgi:putative transposase